MPTVENELSNLRRFLKDRLRRDVTTFYGHEDELKNVYDLLHRTVDLGESNSLLLIGPRGSGKTTLLNAVLTHLVANKDFRQNTLIVHLNGNLHTDDRVALTSITLQMQLKNAADGKVFGSFAENLAFLLACLKAGSKRSKSVIFVLEEFDLFCTHHNQTLLYNLFDVSQSAQAPICVLGLTCRLDVIELLEKRVKSRFSHRQIFLFPNAEDFSGYVTLFRQLLSIPSDKELKQISERVALLRYFEKTELTFWRNHYDPCTYKFNRKFVEAWHKHLAMLFDDKAVKASMQALYDYDISISFLKCFLFRFISQMQAVETIQESHINVTEFTKLVEIYETDDKIELLCGLSVLEICLVISMKHHSEIYDRDPFNFEIIFSRFNKFAKASTTMQGVERAVVLKAFEHLKNLEFVLPVSNAASNVAKAQKEFDMHRLTLTNGQINHAVKNYQALPTEITQWLQSSLI